MFVQTDGLDVPLEENRPQRLQDTQRSRLRRNHLANRRRAQTFVFGQRTSWILLCFYNMKVAYVYRCCWNVGEALLFSFQSSETSETRTGWSPAYRSCLSACASNPPSHEPCNHPRRCPAGPSLNLHEDALGEVSQDLKAMRKSCQPLIGEMVPFLPQESGFSYGALFATSFFLRSPNHELQPHH